MKVIPSVQFRQIASENAEGGYNMINDELIIRKRCDWLKTYAKLLRAGCTGGHVEAHGLAGSGLVVGDAVAWSACR